MLYIIKFIKLDFYLFSFISCISISFHSACFLSTSSKFNHNLAEISASTNFLFLPYFLAEYSFSIGTILLFL